MKPGSQMPANYLRHSGWHCLGYCSQCVTCLQRAYEAASMRTNNHSRPLRRQACEVARHEFDFAGTLQAHHSLGTISQAVPAASTDGSAGYETSLVPSPGGGNLPLGQDTKGKLATRPHHPKSAESVERNCHRCLEDRSEICLAGTLTIEMH